MGHNILNFLYIVGISYGPSALTTEDYKTILLKESQFHGVAMETETPYDTVMITRDRETVPLHVTSMDKLCISLSVKTERALQVLSPELVTYVLCERTAITTTSVVYN